MTAHPLLTLPASLAAPSEARPQRLRRARWSTSVAVSVLLHVVLLAALLHQWSQPPPATAVPAPGITVVMLDAPATSQPAGSASAPAKATAQAVSRSSAAAPERLATRKRREAPPPPQAASPPAALAPAAPPETTEAATAVPVAAGSAGVEPLASAAVQAPAPLEAETPPPLAYLAQVSAIIGRARHYPWSALQYREQGDVIVRMHLLRDGTVISANVVQSSGHAALDAEARDVVLRIARFPPFPADYLPAQRSFDIDQPILFRLYRH